MDTVIYKASKILTASKDRRWWRQYALPKDAVVYCITTSSSSSFYGNNTNVDLFTQRADGNIRLEEYKRIPSNVTSFHWEPYVVVPAGTNWYFVCPASDAETFVEIYYYFIDQ